MTENQNPTLSPSVCKLTNSTDIIRTPCRRLGLKRRSISTPLHTNILKKFKDNDETKVIENVDTSSTKANDNHLVPGLNYNKKVLQKNILDKQLKIEELKSELKNSEQHNLSQINELSNKWIGVCQEALVSLFNTLNENQNSNVHTMQDLISNLGIDPDLINFDSNNQEFY